MTTSATAVAEDPRKTATTNAPKNTVVQATATHEPMLFFRPETGEFLLVPPEDMTSFTNECRRLDLIIDAFHKANDKLDTTLDTVHQQQKQPLPQHSESEQLRKQLEDAYAEAKKARAKLYGELKGLGKLDGNHTSIVELIPIHKTVNPDKSTTAWIRSKKFTYVRSDKIKSHWRSYALRDDEKKSANKSFIKKNDKGEHQIDTKELAKGVKDLKFKLKHEFYKVEEHAVQGVLFDWAEAWNKKLTLDFAKSNPQSQLAQHIDLTAQAQLMRYLAGVGLANEFDWKKKRCALKASARAEFAVAEAKAAVAAFFPDKVGWVWNIQGDDGKKYPMGAFRFKAELALSGVVGASLVAEAGLAVDLSKEKREEVFGAKGYPIEAAKDHPRELRINGKPVDPSASAELEAFAGAKAEAKLVGSIQWLNPEKMTDDYCDFAKVGPSVAGLLGAGAGCLFEVTYVAGKFRFKAMASVCLGVGAKGKLELEVDAVLIGEFVTWFFYQLYHANFKKLEFVEREAFQTIVQMQVLLVDGVTEGYRRLEDFVGKEADDIRETFREVLSAYNREERRVQLMERILSNSKTLLYATPEAKGIFLYQLTRHDWRIDGLDERNHAGAYYGQRKRAIKAILRCAHTKRDFDNMVQHMSATGAKGNLAANRAQLESFLDMAVFGGADDDEEVNRFYDQLTAMLKEEPSVGYPVCHNDDTMYALQRSGDEHIAIACLPGIDMQSVA